MTDAMLRLERVSKIFAGSTTPAVADLSFEVPVAPEDADVIARDFSVENGFIDA